MLCRELLLARWGCRAFCKVCSSVHQRKKEKFMLFSDQVRSLPRRQPGAMTIGHSPKGEGKGRGRERERERESGRERERERILKRSVHHLSSKSPRTRFAAGLSLTAKAGSCARSCFADGTAGSIAPLPWPCRSAMTGLCMRQGHFQAKRHFQGQAHGMHVTGVCLRQGHFQAKRHFQGQAHGMHVTGVCLRQGLFQAQRRFQVAGPWHSCL